MKMYRYCLFCSKEMVRMLSKDGRYWTMVTKLNGFPRRWRNGTKIREAFICPPCQELLHDFNPDSPLPKRRKTLAEAIKWVRHENKTSKDCRYKLVRRRGNRYSIQMTIGPKREGQE